MNEAAVDRAYLIFTRERSAKKLITFSIVREATINFQAVNAVRERVEHFVRRDFALRFCTKRRDQRNEMQDIRETLTKGASAEKRNRPPRFLTKRPF